MRPVVAIETWPGKTNCTPDIRRPSTLHLLANYKISSQQCQICSKMLFKKFFYGMNNYHTAWQ